MYKTFSQVKTSKLFFFNEGKRAAIKYDDHDRVQDKQMLLTESFYGMLWYAMLWYAMLCYPML